MSEELCTVVYTFVNGDRYQEHVSLQKAKRRVRQFHENGFSNVGVAIRKLDDTIFYVLNGDHVRSVHIEEVPK